MGGMLRLKDSLGVGPDLVPPAILKKCAQSLSGPLTVVFNKSLFAGIFPHVWKLSHITPIFKSGSRKQITNYRSIAILPSVGKLFESLLTTSISPAFSHVISSCQHGFVRGRSTCTNLTEFTSFALQSIESGKQVDVVYTDFSKAFDRIHHGILFRKLENLGVHSSLLAWIKSYLTDRSQYIMIQGRHSRVFRVKSGVPQGSHLGPLLFILFINDIVESLQHCRCLLFADDSKLFNPLVTDVPYGTPAPHTIPMGGGKRLGTNGLR